VSDISPADWLAAIAALLAAVAAICAVIVALLQWKATHRQTDAALLQKRMQVYRDAGGAASYVMRHADIDTESEKALREATHWAPALFDEQTALHVARMWELARFGLLNKSWGCPRSGVAFKDRDAFKALQTG
jgi:hypothetical protein